MKLGAVIATSIFLVDQILDLQKPAKVVLKKYIKKNKYIGSKDKKLLYQTIFSSLKKYYALLDVCKKYKIIGKTKNLILFNFCNTNKDINFDDLFLGKYSIIKEQEDNYIYLKAIKHEKEIRPKLPKWIENKISIIEDKEKFCLYESILEEPKFDIVVNMMKYSRENIKKKFNELNITCDFTKISPHGITLSSRLPKSKIDNIKQDMFEVQDEGSQLMTLMSNAKSNMQILDYCAGKGTKTLMINNLTNSKSDIFVYDKSSKRLEILKQRVKKLKLNTIKFNISSKKHKNYFDLILCDVPCSGTGVWRRRPEDVISLKSEELSKLKQNQYEILTKATYFCKTGGSLVYITCSVIYDENESQVKKFLKNNLNFTCVDLKERVKSYFPNNNNTGLSKYGFILSPGVINTDGYFISVLKKLS